MKDYKIERETVTTVKYLMEGESYGADVGKMWTHAEQAWKKSRGLRDDASIPDDALFFLPHDEGIVIAFHERKLDGA